MRPEDYPAVLDLVSRGYVKRSWSWVDWCFVKSPVFRPDRSAVAEIEGRIVGVWLSGTRTLRIAEDLLVPSPAALVVVDPNQRRKGIGTSLVAWAKKRESHGPNSGSGTVTETEMVRFGVASEETRKNFWSRITTSFSIPDRALTYSKTVTLVPAQEAARQASRPEMDDRPGRHGPLAIRVEVAGMPKHTLLVTPTGIKVTAEPCQEAEITLRGEAGSLGPSSLVASFLTGRLKISGMRHIWRLVRCRRVLASYAARLPPARVAEADSQGS